MAGLRGSPALPFARGATALYALSGARPPASLTTPHLGRSQGQVVETAGVRHTCKISFAPGKWKPSSWEIAACRVGAPHRREVSDASWETRRAAHTRQVKENSRQVLPTIRRLMINTPHPRYMYQLDLSSTALPHVWLGSTVATAYFVIGSRGGFGGASFRTAKPAAPSSCLSLSLSFFLPIQDFSSSAHSND